MHEEPPLPSPAQLALFRTILRASPGGQQILDTLDDLPNQWQLATTPADPNPLRLLFERTLDAAGNARLVDPSGSVAYPLVKHAAAAGAAFFATTTGLADAVSIQLEPNAKPLLIPAAAPDPDADALHWINAYYAATIAKNGTLLSILCTINGHAIERASGKLPSFYMPYARFLQAIWATRAPDGTSPLAPAHDSASRSPALQAVLDALTYETQIKPRSQITQIMEPQLTLLIALLDPDVPRADLPEKLDHTLIEHANFWTGHPKRAANSHGNVAWGLLAIAAIAQSLGQPLAPTGLYPILSQYLPPCLLATTPTRYPRVALLERHASDAAPSAPEPREHTQPPHDRRRSH